MATPTFPAPALVALGVLLVKCVAGRTVGFLGVCGGNADATQDVFSPRYGFEVRRVDTGSVSTKMVYIKAGWYRANKQFVGNTMGGVAPTRNPEEPVPLAPCAATPSPTAGVQHSRPLHKSGDKVGLGIASVHASPPVHVSVN